MKPLGLLVDSSLADGFNRWSSAVRGAFPDSDLRVWSVTQDAALATRVGAMFGKSVDASAGWQSLRELMAECDCVVIHLPSKDHLRAVLEAARLPRSPNLLSLCRAGIDSRMMSPVVAAWKRAQAKSSRPGVWSFAETYRYETSVTKLKMVIEDVGTLRGGSITLSSPHSSLAEMTTRVVAVVRRVVGEVRGGQAWADDKSVAGVVSLASGSEVTFNVQVSAPPVIKATFWGAEGKASLQRNAEGLLEVQRQLGLAFENPSLHDTTGHSWSVKGWRDRCLSDEHIDINTPEAAVIDMSVAEALIDANGVQIALVQA